jgi:hypothetical protein
VCCRAHGVELRPTAQDTTVTARVVRSARKFRPWQLDRRARVVMHRQTLAPRLAVSGRVDFRRESLGDRRVLVAVSATSVRQPGYSRALVRMARPCRCHPPTTTFLSSFGRASHPPAKQATATTNSASLLMANYCTPLNTLASRLEVPIIGLAGCELRLATQLLRRTGNTLGESPSSYGYSCGKSLFLARVLVRSSQCPLSRVHQSST